MNKGTKELCFFMIMGAVGTVLIAAGAFRYQLIKDMKWFAIIFFGFLLTISYIEFLEKKAGISKKITWIRAIISLLLFFIVSLILFL
ncbi:hypothetical protein [Virgibacillus siamensis]|uniref:hypothetical protein n=1 Tax=Virgibacillus siamensis TaxID=480071 RepID=UPI000985AB96|nr:hypothetical protein [Virgibacillus siamensis]